jgi:hypothetical protein
MRVRPYLPPGPYLAEPLGYLCVAEPLRTGKIATKMWPVSEQEGQDRLYRAAKVRQTPNKGEWLYYSYSG